MAHTPGPWMAQGSEIWTEDKAVFLGEFYAFHIHNPMQGEDDEANAVLVAAVTDLLAACENLLSAIEDLIGDDEFDYLGECMRDARAAIARGKGEGR